MIFANYYNKNNKATTKQLINYFQALYEGAKLTSADFLFILNNINDELLPELQKLACAKRDEVYGKAVFIRGLIEITNYCQRDCFYCGIRKSNEAVQRYRYDKNKIAAIVARAYRKGYRTIVLQGGEDDYYTPDLLVNIISSLKKKYPEMALTLSLGEKTKATYQALFAAGANRYLLRHESASKRHYGQLHPPTMSYEQRMQCLRDLKAIGYQTGAGLMVGSPYQTNEDLVQDLLFLQEFKPHMIGIGPYLRHYQTPFKNKANGVLEHVLVIYCLARLLVPRALLPSTTATSSLAKDGRLKALRSGCNVIMINLSDEDKRVNYSLYENKTYKGDESVAYLKLIENDIESAALEMDFSIGNYRK